MILVTFTITIKEDILCMCMCKKKYLCLLKTEMTHTKILYVGVIGYFFISIF